MSTNPLRTLFAAVVFLLASHASATERLTVAPAFYYLFHNVPEPKYSSRQEVFALAKAEIEAQKDPVSGMSYWRVAGSTPSGVTWNQQPLLELVIERLENGTYRPSHTTGGYITKRPACPEGFNYAESALGPNDWKMECVSARPYPEVCDPCERVGNPIIPSSFVKIQDEVDYRSVGPGGLQFVRTYRSDRNGWEHNYALSGVDMRASLAVPPSGIFPPPPEPPRVTGCVWGFVLGSARCFGPVASGLANDLRLRRGNGPMIKFGSAIATLPAAHINDRWMRILENGVHVANDVYNASNESTERYSLNGLLQKSTHRSGHITSFSYLQFGGQPGSPEYVLRSVTDHFGRQMTFTYNAKGLMETMTTPANETFTYRYDEPSGGPVAVGNLTSVTYPDQSKRIYWYNEPEHTNGDTQRFALTGITDENGARYATYKYSQGGYAESTEHAGGVQRYNVSGVLYNGEEHRYVIDPLGSLTQSRYALKQGGLRLVRTTRPAGAGAPEADEFRSYDVNGNIESVTDYRGLIAKYRFDLARNLEITRTEAFGKPEQRTTTTEWHTTFRLPARVAEPKRRTTYTYHPNGELKTRTIQATTDASGASAFAAALTGTARTWTYAYNAQWQLASVTGPVSTDITTYAHDAVTGDLQTVTNAAGHVTRFEEYDGNGRAGLITQPNGVKTRMRYSPRGWLESMTVSDGGVDLVTTYSYDNVGQLKTVTMPSRSVITYTYDDAHRLTDVADAKGNKIHYVLDNMGNRISEEVTDPSGNLRRQLTREFDALNRLRVQTGGAQ